MSTVFAWHIVNDFVIACVLSIDDSDDDREVSRKRTVRQAASKAVSKQREILLGDGGSEDEEHEDQEEPYMDRTYKYIVHWYTISCLDSKLYDNDTDSRPSDK